MSIFPGAYISRVKGLRDITFGGEVRVYRALPDGKPGELLRTETQEDLLKRLREPARKQNRKSQGKPWK